MPEELLPIADRLEAAATLLNEHFQHEEKRRTAEEQRRRRSRWARWAGGAVMLVLLLLSVWQTNRGFQASEERRATLAAVEATKRANCGLYVLLLRQREQGPSGLTPEQQKRQDEFFEQLQTSVNQLGCVLPPIEEG